MICILTGLPCEMDFSHNERPWWEMIAHGKMQNEFSLILYISMHLNYANSLYTMHKVEDHENHARWIDLTTVLSFEESQNYTRTKHTTHFNFFQGTVYFYAQQTTPNVETVPLVTTIVKNSHSFIEVCRQAKTCFIICMYWQKVIKYEF